MQITFTHMTPGQSYSRCCKEKPQVCCTLQQLGLRVDIFSNRMNLEGHSRVREQCPKEHGGVSEGRTLMELQTALTLT